MSGASSRLARFVAKGGPDLLGIEAAILKEARLLCTLAQAARAAAAPNLRRRTSRASCVQSTSALRSACFDLRVRDALLPQLGPDADRPLAALGVVMDEAGRRSARR